MSINSLLTTLHDISSVVLKDAEKQLTGQLLVAEVQQRSKQLQAYGVNANSTVLVRLTNKVNTVVSLLSTLDAGATVFVGNPYEPIEETASKSRRFGLQYIIGEKPALRGVSATLNKQDVKTDVHFLDDFQFISTGIPAQQNELLHGERIALFSSGTTGAPKAIVHAFSNILSNANMHADSIGLKSSDVVGGVLPVYYSFGLVASLFASLAKGCCYCFQPRSSTVDENWASEEGISVLSLTPFFANQLEATLPSLRLLTLGGDALSSDIAKAIKTKFNNCELYSTYGLTEAGPRVSTWRFDNKPIPKDQIVPLGEPLTGVSLRLEQVNAANNIGELIVNTPTKMLGYLVGDNQPAIIPEWPGQDVCTGDLFSEIDQRLVFRSRKKELIVQNGEKIYPPVIESLIKQISSVVDAIVVGVDSEEKGQVAKAQIQCSQELTVQEIRKTLLCHLPHAVIPSQFEFVERIQRSQTGKKISLHHTNRTELPATGQTQQLLN